MGGAPPVPPLPPAPPVVVLPPEPPPLPVAGVPVAPDEVDVDPPAPGPPVATVDPVSPDEVPFFALSEVEQLTKPATHAPQSSSAVARAPPVLGRSDFTQRPSPRTAGGAEGPRRV